MLERIKRKKILFGAGKEAHKFFRHFYGKILFEYVMDNKKQGSFYGVAIRKPQYETGVFIIVAVKQDYFEIRKQLIGLGYHEFEDFIPSALYDRKMAIAYGNCHMELLKRYLERHKNFSAEYGFYPFPQIQEMEKDFPFGEILPYAKLLLHQSIRDNNKFGFMFSSRNIITMTLPDCKIVSCPNLYGMPKCFFPQLTRFENKIAIDSIFLSYREKNIERWIKDGMEKETIKKKLQGGIYSKDEIVSLWEDFKHKLIKREEQWDIKISDYILEKYKTEKLFNEPWHITTNLGKEIAVRILKHLGYQNYTILYTIHCMDDNEVFIYQDVKKALGLKFEEKTIRNYSRNISYTNVDMDFDEYINELYQYVLIYLKNEEGGST